MNKTGFGYLRFPKQEDGTYPLEKISQMADAFLSLGGTYFDTGYNYMDSQSEPLLRESVVKRYPRDQFRVAAKMPIWLLKSSADCRTYFDEQKKNCGVDYFDHYLLHGMNGKSYETCTRCGAFDFLQEIKASGEARRTGFSFHDEASVLEHILTEHPEVDFVQLQINYLDWDSPSIQSRLCYETAVRHGKPIIVMEPVKGGTLAKLPEEADAILRRIHPDDSSAKWALRFAQNLPGVECVLSGMNEVYQIEENLIDFPPLNQQEITALRQVREIVHRSTAIACTGCRYCVDQCPKQIAIPDYFELFNEYSRTPSDKWYMEPVYRHLQETGGSPSVCIGCRSCENHCPQKLPISMWLKKLSAVFEK